MTKKELQIIRDRYEYLEGMADWSWDKHREAETEQKQEYFMERFRQYCRDQLVIEQLANLLGIELKGAK